MIYEYAIDPAVLCQCRDGATCKYIQDSFGLGTGRRPARFPKAWVRNAVAHSAGLSPMQQKRVEILARHLKDCSVRTCRTYDPARSWFENAKQEHERQPFQAALSTEALFPDFLTLDQLFSADGNTGTWNTPHTRVVPRTPEAMADCMAPLLRLSSEVVLVDPYAQPTKIGCADFMKRCLEQVAQARGGADVRFEVLVATQSTGDRSSFLRGWERALATCHSVAQQAVFWRLSNRVNGDRLHNRYVITDVGGLFLGNSFDGHSSTDTDDVAILDRGSYLVRRAEFFDSRDDFTTEGDAPVVVRIGQRLCG